MTGLLKETLRERADAHTPPSIDVDTLIRAGDRRLRRSRLTAGLAAAGVAGILATGAVLAPQILATGTPGNGQVAGQGREEPAAPFAERRPTYAVGGALHYGDTTIHVGEPIESFVQTDDGFVYATDDGGIHLADGETTDDIGLTHRAGLHLRADDSGSLVAWVEPSNSGHPPELVVYDTAARSEVARTSDGATPGTTAFRDTDAAQVYAVDDGMVYWRIAERVMALDVASGRSELLLAGAGASDISDVANGRFAHVSRETDGEDTPLRVSTDLEHPSRPLPSGWEGFLSPGARYVSTDQADELAVYDVATREDVTPDTSGYEFVASYAWLDDSTVTLIGIEELGGSQPIDILECTVPRGSCTVVADDVTVYTESKPPQLALPVGQRLDD